MNTANGKHKCRKEHLEGLRLQILADAYEGHVSIAKGDVNSNDFVEVGRQIAEDLGVRFDAHIDRPSDTAIVRLNLGLPINVQPFSEQAKEILAQPGRLEAHQMWQSLFYGNARGIS